jgi:hypothetical protein
MTSLVRTSNILQLLHVDSKQTWENFKVGLSVAVGKASLDSYPTQKIVIWILGTPFLKWNERWRSKKFIHLLISPFHKCKISSIKFIPLSFFFPRLYGRILTQWALSPNQFQIMSIPSYVFVSASTSQRPPFTVESQVNYSQHRGLPAVVPTYNSASLHFRSARFISEAEAESGTSRTEDNAGPRVSPARPQPVPVDSEFLERWVY